MTEFDFDKDKYLEELKTKEFFTVYDSDYMGNVSERAVITQSTKGVFAGVVETKTSGRKKSLITFFRISYPEGTYNIWNAKKQPLTHNSQNLNRVFRNKQIISEIGDDNLIYLRDIGNVFMQFVYRKKGFYDNSLTTISDGILESLVTPHSELVFSIASSMSDGRGFGDVETAVDRIMYYITVMENHGVKVTYKNILKYMGFTKADMSNDDLKSVSFFTSDISKDFGEEGNVEFDYSVNKVTQHKDWYKSPRALKEVIDIMQKYSREYGYIDDFNDLYDQLTLNRGIEYFKSACQTLSLHTSNINLDKLIKYLYIDVYQHQGIQTMSNAFSMYRDYIQLVGNIKGFVMYPKYLSVAHDIASKAMKSSDAHDSDIANITEEFKDLEGVYKVREEGKLVDYPLVLLRSGKEIQKEATSQSNCLAGYIKNVAKGEDLILSLKNPEDYKNDKKLSLHQSYISIELKRKAEGKLELRQSYATYNSRISDKIVSVLKGIFSKHDINVPDNIIGFDGLNDIDRYEVVSKSFLDTKEVHSNISSLLSDKNSKKQIEVNSYLARL
ncbi:PcfJ domain-containing protein [Streptomyces sp. TRM76323]|uniref:PcfJ domain-containing protein n=1 Tax=Streptomyces tamarix TaxID=3078565 RepID=A0ABU3QKQ0_9ACTN|nr:PcfJ domain-containing protein [Streptomyces tamarix]MDT9683348.1 PcfJ domain-containing protein [Streptomyces tamarix]